MEDETNYNFKSFDFEKAKRCKKSPHSTFIGLWSHWWLETTKNRGHVRDGGKTFLKDEFNWKLDINRNLKRSTQPDLNLLDENEEEVGVVEVENASSGNFDGMFETYKAKAERVFAHLYTGEKLKFGILMVWQKKDWKWDDKMSGVEKYIEENSKKLPDGRVFVFVNMIWNKTQYDDAEIIMYNKHNGRRYLLRRKEV